MVRNACRVTSELLARRNLVKGAVQVHSSQEWMARVCGQTMASEQRNPIELPVNDPDPPRKRPAGGTEVQILRQPLRDPHEFLGRHHRPYQLHVGRWSSKQVVLSRLGTSSLLLGHAGCSIRSFQRP